MQKTDIDGLLRRLASISDRYKLKIIYLDSTDATIMARIGISSDIFIQVYINTKRDKLNLALVVAGERAYGLDRENDLCHEHPFDNPKLHIAARPMEIEDFFLKSLVIMKEMGLL